MLQHSSNSNLCCCFLCAQILLYSHLFVFYFVNLLLHDSASAQSRFRKQLLIDKINSIYSLFNFFNEFKASVFTESQAGRKDEFTIFLVGKRSIKSSWEILSLLKLFGFSRLQLVLVCQFSYSKDHFVTQSQIKSSVE